MHDEGIFLQAINRDARKNPFSIRKKTEPVLPLYEKTLHWHDYCELELILGGRGEHRLNGTVYPVERGDVYLLTQRDLHTLAETEGETVCLYNLNFDEDVLPPSLRRALLSEDLQLCFRMDAATTARIEERLETMLTEFEGNEPWRTERLRAQLVELLIELMRLGASKREETHGTTSDAVRDTITYLREHFREPLTLGECAERVFLSAGYLGEQFYRVTGMHFKDYLTHLRLEYATRLLGTTSLSVGVIGEEVGISTPSYFIALFRKRYGISPAEFRKQQQRA